MASEREYRSLSIIARHALPAKRDSTPGHWLRAPILVTLWTTPPPFQSKMPRCRLAPYEMPHGATRVFTVTCRVTCDDIVDLYRPHSVANIAAQWGLVDTEVTIPVLI